MNPAKAYCKAFREHRQYYRWLGLLVAAQKHPLNKMNGYKPSYYCKCILSSIAIDHRGLPHDIGNARVIEAATKLMNSFGLKDMV